MRKYLVMLVFVTISTSASAQMGQMWRDNRERALDQMQRQHENLQQRMYDYNLYRGGDWYMYDDVYGNRQLREQQRRYQWQRDLELEYDEDE
jgi:hypothetical protein